MFLKKWEQIINDIPYHKNKKRTKINGNIQPKSIKPKMKDIKISKLARGVKAKRCKTRPWCTLLCC
jgi:hypothetical protein